MKPAKPLKKTPLVLHLETLIVLTNTRLTKVRGGDNNPVSEMPDDIDGRMGGIAGAC